jgi:hypothetical protein
MTISAGASSGNGHVQARSIQSPRAISIAAEREASLIARGTLVGRLSRIEM